MASSDQAVAFSDSTMTLRKALHQLVIQCSDIASQPSFQFGHVAFRGEKLSMQSVALVDGAIEQIHQRPCTIALDANREQRFEESNAE